MTYPAFSDATIDMWVSFGFGSCKGDGPERGTSGGAIFCSVFAVMPATCNEIKEGKNCIKFFCFEFVSVWWKIRILLISNKFISKIKSQVRIDIEFFKSSSN